MRELICQTDFRPSLRDVAPLVFAGAKLDEPITRCGGTPLLSAAYHGHLHVVEFLLNHGAPRDSVVKGGKNALMVAAFRNQQDVVAYLAHQGYSLRDRDAFNNTPFMLACLGGSLKVMTWLKTQVRPPKHQNKKKKGGDKVEDPNKEATNCQNSIN